MERAWGSAVAVLQRREPPLRGPPGFAVQGSGLGGRLEVPGCASADGVCACPFLHVCVGVWALAHRSSLSARVSVSLDCVSVWMDVSVPRCAGHYLKMCSRHFCVRQTGTPLSLKLCLHMCEGLPLGLSVFQRTCGAMGSACEFVKVCPSRRVRSLWGGSPCVGVHGLSARLAPDLRPPRSWVPGLMEAPRCVTCTSFSSTAICFSLVTRWGGLEDSHMRPR